MRYKDELPFIYENTDKINALLAEGLAEGELIAYFKLVQDKTLTLPIAAQKANISEEEFVNAMKKAGYDITLIKKDTSS